MIVKKTILRLLGSSDDKEKIGVARPEGPPLQGFRLGFYTGLTDAKEIAYVGALTDEDRGNSIHRMNRRLGLGERRCSCPENWFLEFKWQLHSPVKPT